MLGTAASQTRPPTLPEGVCLAQDAAAGRPLRPPHPRLPRQPGKMGKSPHSVTTFQALAASFVGRAEWGGPPSCSPQGLLSGSGSIQKTPEPQPARCPDSVGLGGAWALVFLKSSQPGLRIARLEAQVRAFGSAPRTATSRPCDLGPVTPPPFSAAIWGWCKATHGRLLGIKHSNEQHREHSAWPTTHIQ